MYLIEVFHFVVAVYKAIVYHQNETNMWKVMDIIQQKNNVWKKLWTVQVISMIMYALKLFS